jgi:hypothetical protein
MQEAGVPATTNFTLKGEQLFTHSCQQKANIN